ncbi:carboxyvinyl-carboxyphosphonate phosphorylmutase [Sporormia fimetaria CBS 119925]|uniref:Carboxyvinyl-carboxyphosphonate phosphorylmutase n=1 Tax=Sporormia fimetaria CBS 119925 TaxID=1340428 RepID=A0A6A6VDT8_9PLEO|nr:carboxyvinyl-carboxyphosphonate phosphorylmutase [Sporormia fimetaria CBS 119925]
MANPIPPKESGEAFIPGVQKLRNMLAEKGKLIVCPGVYDGFTARIALAEGVECLYMTGAGTTMSRLGQADMGVATLNDMLTNASMIANLDPSVPLIADADTGYGGAIMVGRTVRSYINANIAGLHLEDQVVSKRCGHLRGKQLVPTSEFVSRIRAAVLARQQSHGDIVIIARTDALAEYGYDEALQRLKAAVDAGADAVFLEGVQSREQAERLVREMKNYGEEKRGEEVPCLFNHVPGGVSPDFTTKECEEIGYRIVIFPCASFEMVYPAVQRAMRQIKEKGFVESFYGEGGQRHGPRELFEVCGLGESMEFDRLAGGGAYGEDA